MNEKVDYFLNERMRVLIVIKEHQVQTTDGIVCPLNQNEIAKYVGISKVKANQLLNELIDTGYVKAIKKSRYLLTKNASDIISKLDLGE